MEKNNDNKKKTMIFAIIAIAALLIAVIGATFAYFQAQIGTGATANVTLTTHSTDSLTFSTGAAVTIGPLTQQNFGPTAEDASGLTTGTVTLRASADAAATYCYNAYFRVTSNNLVYTTAPTNTPELLLTATKNSTDVLDDEDITTVSAYTAQNDTDIDFPTAANGSTYKHTITATAGNTTTDNWTVTVTFVNLESDQQSNTGKTFQGTIYFDSVSC